jgi:glycerol-3-phosphate dehydrogenase
MNELLEEAVPPAQHCQLAYLSGPSFAIEVAQGKPTGLAIAAKVRQQLTVLTSMYEC